MLFPVRQPAPEQKIKSEREPGMKCFHVCQPAGDLTDTMFQQGASLSYTPSKISSQ